jgi:cytochrome c
MIKKNMKRIIVPVLALMVLAACNNSDPKDKKEDKPVAQATDNSGNPDYTKGLGLVAKSDCLTCHKIDEPLTGPPYREVANKYAGLPDTIVTHLANKIISGGKGVWGEVYMTPHPGISTVDAQAMVKYILLLKK